MILPSFRTMSRSSAMYAGATAVLVCALGVTEANARVLGVDELRTELNDARYTITNRQLSDEIVLAQSEDDCGCGDTEDFGDEFGNAFEESLEDEFDRAFEEGFEEGLEEGFNQGYDGGYANNQGQGLSAEQQRRLNQVLDRQTQMIEAQILWTNPLGEGSW